MTLGETRCPEADRGFRPASRSAVDRWATSRAAERRRGNGRGGVDPPPLAPACYRAAADMRTTDRA
jgi:hypothetical protein